jgi:mannan polymerase II complex ANP1 subunit
MEQERQARENEERERAERMKNIKEQYTDPRNQWEQDKTDIQNIALQDKVKEQSSEVSDISEPGVAI